MPARHLPRNVTRFFRPAGRPRFAAVQGDGGGMTAYQAPVRDMQFVMAQVAGLEDVAALPGYGEASPDLVSQILTEAARFAGEVLAPLNRLGDTVPSRL